MYFLNKQRVRAPRLNDKYYILFIIPVVIK